MIADSADIRFECSQCGQHLVVESAGAGLTADCPICNTSVTVPTHSVFGATGLHERGNGGSRGRHGLGSGVAMEAPRSPFADPLPDDLREELVDASLINGKLLRDLEQAREENARLQQQVKTLGDECEHLHASDTHTRAELKTFQSERQQAKAELSVLRQKCNAVEEVLATREAELAEARAEARRVAGEWEARARAAQSNVEATSQGVKKLAAELESKNAAFHQALADAEVERERVTAQCEEARRELAAAQARIANIEGEFQTTRSRLGEVEASLVTAEEDGRRQTQERDELQRSLADARNQLSEVGELRAKLEQVGSELRDQGGKLRFAEDSNAALTTRCEELCRENEALKRDLTESHAGRELLETRSKLDEALAEQSRTIARLQAVEAEVKALSASEANLRNERDRARTERDEALASAAHFSETRTAKDNDVLRGINARLNADLVQRTAEVMRAKRARSGLKAAYVLFVVGLLAVIALALVVIPQALK